MESLIYVIGYARVSSVDQARGNDSLENQEFSIREYCKRKGYILFEDKVFKEAFTGSNTFRPAYTKIKEILQSINNGKIKKIKYLIFYDFDRLTRGGSDEYEKIWSEMETFSVELRDTKDEIIKEDRDLMKEEFGFDYSFSWAKGRPSEDMEKQRTEEAKRDKKRILQKLIFSEIRLTQNGYQIGKPDYGFRNKKILAGTKERFVQSPYEDEAKFVIEMFNLRAEGVFSDNEICDKINAMGYKSARRKKWSKDQQNIIGYTGSVKLKPKELQNFIKRTSYCGIICKKWTKYIPIKAKWEGIVSIDLWNRANRGKFFLEQDDKDKESFMLLKNINPNFSKKKQKYNPSFKYRGIVCCDVCGNQMTASFSQGKSGKKFPFYHCSKNHKQFSKTKKEVEDIIDSTINSISFKENFIKELTKSLEFQFQEQEKNLAKFTSETNINVSNLEIEKSKLFEAYINEQDEFIKNEIRERFKRKEEEIVKARNERNKAELEEDDVTNFLRFAKELMEHPEKTFEDIDSKEELLSVFSLFVEDLPRYSDFINGTLNLTKFFKLNKEFSDNKNYSVGDTGFEPVTSTTSM